MRGVTILLCLAWGCDSRSGLDGPSPERCAPGTLIECPCADGSRSITQCTPDRYPGACRCGEGVDGGQRDSGRPDASQRPIDPRLPDALIPDALIPDMHAAPDVLSPDAGQLDDPDAAPPEQTGCPTPPEFVRIDGVDVFRYEASHPRATAGLAYPGARQTGADGPPAPGDDPEACSIAGVRPWHSVTHERARLACAQSGWRLCGAATLRRACGGPASWAWTYGVDFVGGRCNLREAYRATGQEFASVAPSGEFSDCTSREGLFDATGNLWEWTAEGVSQGAGWRTIAERHRDDDLRCDAQIAALPVGHRSASTGFRCCR